MKMEVSSPKREMLLFLITSMTVVVSHVNQQLKQMWRVGVACLVEAGPWLLGRLVRAVKTVSSLLFFIMLSWLSIYRCRPGSHLVFLCIKHLVFSGGWDQFLASCKTVPYSLSKFDTHPTWQPVMRSVQSWQYYRKKKKIIGDCE